MKEHNYTIPINEALEENVPCFICKIEADLEARALEYYMGAAVMEPAVRIEMNEKGFCRTHLSALYEGANKLPLALALETRMKSVLQKLEKAPKKSGAPHTCVVCDRVHGQMEKCEENVLWLLRHEADFLPKYLAGDGVCLHHYYHITDKLRRGEAALYKAIHAHMVQRLKKESADLERFRNLFDYRSREEEGAWAADVLPRAIKTLGAGRE